MLRVLRFVAIVAALALYVVSFWGKFAGASWPRPVREYAGCATAGGVAMASQRVGCVI